MGQCGVVEKRGELWLRAGSRGDPGSVALTPVLSERHLLSRVISSRFFCEALRLSPGKTRVTRTPWGWATGFGLKGVGAGERFRVATGCVTTELGARLVVFSVGVSWLSPVVSLASQRCWRCGGLKFTVGTIRGQRSKRGWWRERLERG